MEINFTWLSNNFAKNISNRELSDLHGFPKQELTFRIAISVINVILSFTALFGNSAILITIWKTSSLHSVANIFLAYLAVSDLAVGLVVQPLFIANVLSGVYTVHLPSIILGPTLNLASFFTITAIAFDRLLALQLHLRYEELVTPFRVTRAVILIWVSAAIFFKYETLDCKPISRCNIFYDDNHSRWKLCCLFENLSYCSTPSETYSTTTTTELREHFQREESKKICYEHICRVHFTSVLLRALFSQRPNEICRCNHFAIRLYYKFCVNAP